MAGSENDVWIPALVVSHVMGILLYCYGLEHMTGAMTGLKYLCLWCCGLYDPKKVPVVDADKAAIKEAMSNGHNGLTPDVVVDVETGKTRPKKMLPVPVELAWHDITYSVQPARAKAGEERKPRIVIKPCSGSFKPCEAVAIMGPSGAGKSSLMDILSGRKRGPNVKGTVTMNTHPINQAITSKYISYVGQEDVFLPVLSTWESLKFYTQLSLSASLSKDERRQRMEAVLETMGLMRVKHTKVGGVLPGGVEVRGLSGGERRRLSIACGLVGNPSVVFLDEPTTGLDSHAALAIINHLTDLTDLGHTIVCSIHQPRQEIFTAFDKVLILSEGYQMYLSSPTDCVRWFHQKLGFPYSPITDGTVADWLIATVSVSFHKTDEAAARSISTIEQVKDAAEKFAAYTAEKEEQAKAEGGEGSILDTNNSDARGTAYKSSIMGSIMSSFGMNMMNTNRDLIAETADRSTLPEGEQSETRQTGKYPRSWFVQYLLLTRRAVFATFRNPMESAVRVLMTVWVGMFAGLVYIRLADNGTSAQPRLSTLFYMSMLNALTPFSYMAFYISDRRFFTLDSANGIYSPSAYYAAAATAALPLIVFNTWCGVLITYGLAALRYTATAIFINLGILTLQALVANQFLVTCVWMTSTQDAAYALATIYITFSLLLAGFYVRIPSIKLSIMKGLSWAAFSRYSFQALALNELQDRVWTEPCDETTSQPLIGGAIPLCSTTGDAILEYFAFDTTVAQNALALLGFLGLFHITAFWALMKLHKKR